MITKIVRNAGLGLIFFTVFIPLYVDNGLFFPFITGKAFAFRIIVEILFAIWLVLLLRDKRYAPRFSWVSLLVTTFVVVVFIADVAGLNPVRSIWSNFERMEGWVALIHLWGYFIVTTSIFGSGEEGRRMWHLLFRTSLFAAFLVGIYGVVQLFGGAQIHQGSTRIDASLGNAAYMAVYMLGHAFLAFYFALVELSRRKTWLVWTYIILGAFFSFLLFETATRGTILGLVGGIMLAFTIYAVFGKGESKKLRLASGGFILLIVLLGVGLVAAKNTPFVKNSTTLSRLASISWKENKTQARGYIWPMAIKTTFESPKTALIGLGQENFNYVFNENYNPAMWGQEQWFDRAHSVYLDWLVAGGLVALLLYLSLFVFAIISLWKSSLTFAEKCLLTGLFVGYAIHNVFVFDNIASYMLFFTILGFTHSLIAGKPFKWLTIRDEQTENMIVVRDYIFLPLIVIFFLVTLYFINIRPIQANKRLIVAMISCNGGVAPSAELYSKALALNQYVANQEIREQLLSCSSTVINNRSISDDIKKAFYDLSLEEIRNQITITPNDARTYVIAGAYLNNIGDLSNSLPLLEKALELSPDKQTIIYEIAINKLNAGKDMESQVLFEKAYRLAPENPTAKVTYVGSLIYTGDEKKAREIFGNEPELFVSQAAVSAYARRGEYDKVIELYKQLIEKDIGVRDYHIGLVTVYYETKQYDKAIAKLEQMKTIFPDMIPKLNETIRQIKAVQK